MSGTTSVSAPAAGHILQGAALQAFLEKDHFDRTGRAGFVSFNWYQGNDVQGTRVAFRFSKGGSPIRFWSHVAQAKLTEVGGPFKTRKAALA